MAILVLMIVYSPPGRGGRVYHTSIIYDDTGDGDTGDGDGDGGRAGQGRAV